MEEEISDREPRIKIKKEFDRLLPSEGILIPHGKYGVCAYMDINDLPSTFSETVNQYRKSELPVGGSHHILKGSTVGKRYRFFSFHDARLVGMYTYHEFLDNPYGYGKEDFFSDRYILPEYRQSLIARFITSDITHFLFTSGLVKKAYTYLKLNSDGMFIRRNDREDAFCLNLYYPSDGEETQNYLKLISVIKTEKGQYGIWESNATIYLEMDLVKYHSTANKNIAPDKTDLEIKKGVLTLLSNQGKAVDSIKALMKVERERKILPVSTRKEDERWK